MKVSVLFLILIVGDTVSRRSWFGRHFCTIFVGKIKSLELNTRNQETERVFIASEMQWMESGAS